jgi:putative glutamine amidotransferase
MPRIVAVTAGSSSAIAADGPNAHGRIRPTPPKVHVGALITDRLKAAGVEVIVLPPAPHDTDALVAWVLEHCHGLVITGGHFDIHPSEYGRSVTGRLDTVDTGRTKLELALARAAIASDFPVLGICGGMQALAVAGGGTLHQDIKTEIKGALEHEQSSDPATPWHPISIDTGLIRKAFGCSILRVNSTHHQAVDDPGCFDVTARAPDGVIEAIEHPKLRCCVGVQWHPELIDAAPLDMLAWFASNPA